MILPNPFNGMTFEFDFLPGPQLRQDDVPIDRRRRTLREYFALLALGLPDEV